MYPLYRAIRAVLTPFVKVFFKPQIIGLENIPKTGKYIVCCNHQSLWDMFVLVINFPYQICFMAKKELFHGKFIGWFFRNLGAFPVNRGTGDTSAFKKAFSVLENGGILGVFPEGTRNGGGAPGKAKAGAALLAIQSGADVLPVSIYYGGKRFFGKTALRFGEVIKSEEFTTDKKPGKTEIRNASNRIMQEITRLWEMKF